MTCHLVKEPVFNKRIRWPNTIQGGQQLQARPLNGSGVGVQDPCL